MKEYKLYANKSKLKRLPSPALEMGTALHEALLEPDNFRISNYSNYCYNIFNIQRR